MDSFIQKVKGQYSCALNDSLMAQEMTIYSNSIAKNTNLPAMPITSKDDGTHKAIRGFCSGKVGIEAAADDPVTCRGFCKPIPTECIVGDDRLCRISNWNGKYYYMRIYVGVDMNFLELKDDVKAKGGIFATYD